MTPLKHSPIPDMRKASRLYLAIAVGCGFFILLTLLAMLTYAGGTLEDHAAPGYSLTRNFLSNLGMLTALSGRPNWVSAGLFFIALGSAGFFLVIFFVQFTRFFKQNKLQRSLALVGSTLGVLAGLSFTAIAFTPADIARPAHTQFVMWAFELFPLAVLFYTPVMFMDQHYPKVYAWLFALFCAMLVGYYLLLTYGPRFDSPTGLVIQVVGQKVIAYASILSIAIQALGARRVLMKDNVMERDGAILHA